jgi:hypothetical protein
LEWSKRGAALGDPTIDVIEGEHNESLSDNQQLRQVDGTTPGVDYCAAYRLLCVMIGFSTLRELLAPLARPEQPLTKES